MAVDPTAATVVWLSAFEDVLSQPTQDSLSLVFSADDCWLRDLLVLSTDFATFHGLADIRAHFVGSEFKARLFNFRLDKHGAVYDAQSSGLTALFMFDVEHSAGVRATARGCVRLVQQLDNTFRAWTVLLVLQDFHGFEESVGRAPIPERNDLSWDEALNERFTMIENDLAVLVVGAGHVGLMIAARLKQLGINVLVIDRSHVGNSWSNRYASLKLHTPTFMCTFPYQPYPSTWPMYLPKTKMAAFLRGYRDAQDLLVWESTEMLNDPSPTYDPETACWSVHISRDNVVQTLHPRHVVLAVGQNNIPRTLETPGVDRFQGTVCHSSVYTDGSKWTGKKVVVIGACNSGADIALDLLKSGASEITIVQRSPNCYVSLNTLQSKVFANLWPENNDTTIDELDMINNSIPFSLLIRMLRSGPNLSTFDQEAIDGMAQAGFKTTNEQLYELMLTRGGGYLLDQGGIAKHIAEGHIQVKHGVELSRFEPDSVIFSDGSALKADVVIAAIGFEGMRATVDRLLGPIAGNTARIWGLDARGELNGVFRPSGHAALWYAAGDYTHARFFGRLLALQILASERNLFSA